MTSTGQTIDLQREELEIRDLRNVIAALRKNLEDQHLEAKALVREALTAAEGDQRQLRETAAALRDEMERMHYDADARVQEANANAYDEIKQLKATSQSLRDAMEEMRFEADARVQQAITNANDEIVQLKAMAQELRDELDSQQYTSAEKLLTLPDETLVYPGHDYNGMTVSTIGEEREFNPRLQVSSAAEYAKIMDNLGPSPVPR